MISLARYPILVSGESHVIPLSTLKPFICGDEVLLYNYEAISLTSLFAFFKTLRVELKQLTLLTFIKSFSVHF